MSRDLYIAHGFGGSRLTSLLQKLLHRDMRCANPETDSGSRLKPLLQKAPIRLVAIEDRIDDRLSAA